MRFLYRVNFNERFLIHQNTPENQTPPEEIPGGQSTEILESIEESHIKRRDLEIKISSEATENSKKQTPETAKLNEDFKTKANAYYEALLEAETPGRIKEIIDLAQSDKVSLIDLQGGWKWLGLSEDEQEKKFSILSKAFLNKTTDKNGQEVFVVKQELDSEYKTKYGLGAGHLIPPSITMAEIRDTNGNSRQGKRETRGNRTGYFDDNGYIAIFAGYTVKPLSFLSEDSEEYKKSLEAEKQHYLNLKNSAKEVQAVTEHTPQYISNYAGKSEITKTLDTTEVQKIEIKENEETPETISAADSPTHRPVYYNYSKNAELSEKPVKYFVYLHGDNSEFETVKTKTLAAVREMRTRGINAVLVVPQCGTEKNENDRWNMLKQQDVFTSLMNSIKTSAGKGEISLIGYSGGYRAIAEILKQPIKVDIKSVTMLDGTFPDSYHNIESELIKFSKTGQVIMYTGSEFARTDETAKKILNQGNSDNIKYIHETSSHGSMENKFLLTGMLSAAGVEVEKSKINQAEMTQFSDFLINLADDWSKRGKEETEQLRGHCEQFCDNLITETLAKLGNIKRKDINFNAPIAEGTANLRGIAISKLTKTQVLENLKPGQVIFSNNPRKYDTQEVVPGTTKKLPKISDKRHWVVYTGIDANGEPRFSDNHKINQTLTEMHRLTGDNGRVIINIHDPLAQYRDNLDNMVAALKTDRSNQQSSPVLAGGPTVRSYAPATSLAKPPAAPAPAAPAVASYAVPAAPESDEKLTTDFQKEIEKITENMKGTVAVNIYDPDTGKYLAQINKNTSMPSASLIKVPILFALHEAVEAGRVDKQDVPRLQKHAEKMIADSNNYSTDEIIRYLGIDRINATIKKLRLKDTQFGGLMNDKTTRTNFITAGDMTKIMTRAINQEPPAGWTSAMDLMQINGHTGKLGEMIPQDVKIARKCGQISDQEHYAATYTLGKKKLVMVVMVSGFDTRGNAKAGIREIGMLVYDALKNKT
ncbi:MAG: serine hydrolase [Patescibacteria group bacterium]